MSNSLRKERVLTSVVMYTNGMLTRKELLLRIAEVNKTNRGKR